ncbi:TPA: DUF3990 domain-containing protein [Clostridium botulinum]|nr:DUF3990 domain-containing protein [Clostridium botulinum]HBJ1655808.1 DUF3990 domain-containing protein [Clostridium botulinum]
MTKFHSTNNSINNTVNNLESIGVYHGSDCIVEKPQIFTKGYYKDFGFGFYVTKIKKQAERWTLKKEPKVVNIYEIDKNYKENLNVKIFSEMTEEWLDFITTCRSGKSHDYDIVEGPMADDTIFQFVNMFISKRITREAFWALCKFKYPIHQILFATEKYLNYLKYKGCYYV